jgi:hypothetical protein
MNIAIGLIISSNYFNYFWNKVPLKQKILNFGTNFRQNLEQKLIEVELELINYSILF